MMIARAGHARRRFASSLLVAVSLAGGVSEAREAALGPRTPRRAAAFATMPTREAPAILELRYHTLDRARPRATPVDFEAFQGITLRAPLIAGITSVGADTLSFGSGMLVCSEVPRRWTKRCRGRVVEEEPVILNLHPPTTAELNLTRPFARGVQPTSLAGVLEIGHRMLYGIEPEPVLQFQLKREMLAFLASLTQDSRILSAAIAIEPTSSIRAIAEAQVTDRERIRATYVEIEGYEVFTIPAPLSTEVALAGTGALLFGTGIFGQKMLHGALGDALAIRPQPWPLGIQIGGTFLSP
jgi:hypothetical protein